MAIRQDRITTVAHRVHPRFVTEPLHLDKERPQAQAGIAHMQQWYGAIPAGGRGLGAPLIHRPLNLRVVTAWYAACRAWSPRDRSSSQDGRCTGGDETSPCRIALRRLCLPDVPASGHPCGATSIHLHGRVTASHRFLVYGSGALGAVLSRVLRMLVDVRTAVFLCARGALIRRLTAVLTGLRRYRG